MGISRYAAAFLFLTFVVVIGWSGVRGDGQDSYTSSTNKLELRQTGDRLGPSRLTVANHIGAGGIIVENETYDLADIQLRTGGGMERLIRFECRPDERQLSENTEGEIIFKTPNNQYYPFTSGLITSRIKGVDDYGDRTLDVLHVTHSAHDTSAPGMGTAISFDAKSSLKDEAPIGRIGFVMTDTHHEIRSSQMFYSTMKAGRRMTVEFPLEPPVSEGQVLTVSRIDGDRVELAWR